MFQTRHPADPVLDSLSDFGPTGAECKQILAFYLPRVHPESTAELGYAQARRELSTILHRDLNPYLFEDTVVCAYHLYVLQTGEESVTSLFPDDEGTLGQWLDSLGDELSTNIDFMVQS